MRKLISYVVSATVGLWLATLIVPNARLIPQADTQVFGFPLAATWQLFLWFGVILGLLQFFTKPISDTLSLPLKLITLGLWGIIVQIIFLGILGSIFEELAIPFLWPMVWTGVILAACHSLASLTFSSNNNQE